MTSSACDNDVGKHDEFLLRSLRVAAIEFAAVFQFFGSMKNLQFLKIFSCTTEYSVSGELAIY